MVKQKDVISVELYNDELDRHSKSEYVVISRDEYNSVTMQLLACEIVYSEETKPYLIPIKVTGLRRNSKVNTLNVNTIKKNSELTESQEHIGEVSNKEFLQIAQAFELNFNFQT